MNKILSFKEKEEFGKKLGECLKKGEFVALIGDLGTGKTTFAKDLAKSLGVEENIKSPTFTYVHEYELKDKKLYHFDVYRLTDPEEIYEIGYEDYLHDDGIIIMEWADIIKSELPDVYIRVEFFYDSEEKRKVHLTVVGDKDREEEILKYVGFSSW